MALHGKNILLRGCQLRNTEWCRGVVVYTGRETKIQMNAAEPATKSSSLKPYVDRETLRVLCVQVGGGVEAAFGGWCRSVVSHLFGCTKVRVAPLRSLPLRGLPETAVPSSAA